MSFGRAVGIDLWLGFAGAEPAVRVPAGKRLRLDRRASALAERAALAAAGGLTGGYAVSRSHTRGMGAAVVAPAGVLLGVDLVALDRVSARHAGAILTSTERDALLPVGALRHALAWGLKEAGAKATGEPERHFPLGLRIERTPDGVVVRAADMSFAAEWLQLGELLAVWVRERRALA